MRRVRRRHVLGALITGRRQVETGEQILSRAEQLRRDGQVHLVDEAGLQKLASGRDAATARTS